MRTWHLDGIEQAAARLDAIGDRVLHPEPALQHGRAVLSRSLARNFSAEGRPAPWPRRVSDAAGNFKYPDKATHPILNKTSRMVAAAVSQSDGGESVARITGASLYFGLTVPYAVYHVSDAPRTRLPRRNFLLFQIEDCEALAAYAPGFFWWGRV